MYQFSLLYNSFLFFLAITTSVTNCATSRNWWRYKLLTIQTFVENIIHIQKWRAFGCVMFLVPLLANDWNVVFNFKTVFERLNRTCTHVNNVDNVQSMRFGQMLSQWMFERKMSVSELSIDWGLPVCATSWHLRLKRFLANNAYDFPYRLA